MWIDERGSAVLGLPECRRLLAVGAKEHRPGHLGIPAEARPAELDDSPEEAPTVLPVDYAYSQGDVVIRVGEGLFSHIAGRFVAFEVEGEENGLMWSVLVRGLAQPIVPDHGSYRPPIPRVAEPGDRFVRIRSDVVTGRRLGSAIVQTEHLAS
jgi:hypothetical protein